MPTAAAMSISQGLFNFPLFAKTKTINGQISNGQTGVKTKIPYLEDSHRYPQYVVQLTTSKSIRLGIFFSLDRPEITAGPNPKIWAA